MSPIKHLSFYFQCQLFVLMFHCFYFLTFCKFHFFCVKTFFFCFIFLICSVWVCEERRKATQISDFVFASKRNSFCMYFLSLTCRQNVLSTFILFIHFICHFLFPCQPNMKPKNQRKKKPTNKQTTPILTHKHCFWVCFCFFFTLQNLHLFFIFYA